MNWFVLQKKQPIHLREDEKLTGCVTVKIRYSDFETTIQAGNRLIILRWMIVLIAKVKDLFNKSYQKGRPVRLLGVRFSQMIPFTMQMSLFENNAEKLNLYKAVDDIKDRFGSKISHQSGHCDEKKDRRIALLINGNISSLSSLT